MGGPLVAVDVPQRGDERRKSWAKVVTNVDEAKSTGWAFEGEFVAVGGIQDLEVGGVLLVYGERGSRTNPRPDVGVYTVNGDATLTEINSAKGSAWARTLRDSVVALLAEPATNEPAELPWSPELASYSALALVEELRRRGIEG